MNAFDVIQMQFRVLEIRPLRQHQPQNVAFNWKFLTILFLIALHILMVFLFLTIEATNYGEYSASIFVILTSFVSIIFYLSFECQSNSVFKLIDDLDHFTFTRRLQLPYRFTKFQCIKWYPLVLGSKISNMRKAYERSGCTINRLMHRIHFAMVKMSLNFGFGSIAILCTLNYIFNDFDESALILPVLMW